MSLGFIGDRLVKNSLTLAGLLKAKSQELSFGREVLKQKQWFVSFLKQQALKPLHIGIEVRSSTTNRILITA